MRGLRIGLVAVALLIGSILATLADGTYTPPTVDFLAPAQNTVTSVGTMISSVLPVAGMLFAIVMGVRYLFKIVKIGSKG